MSFAERCFSGGSFENMATCPNCHTEFEGPRVNRMSSVTRTLRNMSSARRLSELEGLVRKWMETDDAADSSTFGDLRSPKARAKRDEAYSRYFKAREALRKAMRPEPR